MFTGLKEGDRLRLVSISDPFTKLKPGDEGTVASVDSAVGVVDVQWDVDGHYLGLVPGEDRWERI